VFRFLDSSGTKGPKILTIGDTYFMDFYEMSLPHYGFNDGEFWHSNNLRYIPSLGFSGSVNDENVDFQVLVESHDAIILMFTEWNLKEFAYGFIDNLYEVYCDEKSIKERKEINELIMSNLEWLTSIRAQAKEWEVSEEQAILMTIEFIREERKKSEVVSSTVNSQ